MLDIRGLMPARAELHEEIFDTAELLAESTRMVLNQAQKAEIALFTDIAPDLPALKADKRRIRQILLNLMSNALKFTPAGGRVTISAQLSEAGLVLAGGR